MVRPDTITRDAHAVVSTVVILLGVVLFGWSASVLLVVYWVEAGVAIVRGAVQGLFATHSPKDLTIDHKLPLSSWGEKRGGVSVGLLPPIYPRNVPVVIASIIVLVMLWPIAGAVVLASIDSGLPVGSVVVGGVSLVVGHSVGFGAYLANDQYTDAAVRSALLRRHVLSVLALGVGGMIIFAYASPPSALLVVVVVFKLAGDLVFSRLDSVNSRTEWDNDPIADRVPGADPIERFRVSRMSILIRAAGYTPLYLVVPPYLLLTLGAVFAGLIGGRGVGLAVGLLAVGVTALGQVVRAAVQTAHLEYHIYPSRIVAYDTLLGTPQWTINRPTVTEVAIESSRFDRIRPGSRTAIVSVHDKEYRLQGLRRPEAFVELSGGSRS